MIMSQTIWTIVVTAVVTFIASFGAAYWQIREMRAIANPAHKPEKSIRNVVGRVTYFIKKYWAWAVALLLPVWVVARELMRPEPLAKSSVFVIFVFTVVLSVEISLMIAIALLTYALKRLGYLSSTSKQATQQPPDSTSPTGS